MTAKGFHTVLGVVLVQVAMVTSSSSITSLPGHYPSSFCHIQRAALDTTSRQFLFEGDLSETRRCDGLRGIWPVTNTTDISSFKCDTNINDGFVFTIFYWHGISNYFHLHYDMTIPLYKFVYFENKAKDPKKTLFMPTVETKRLEQLDWNTIAFQDPQKYWYQIVKAILGNHQMAPLDQTLLSTGQNICFDNLYFGTPRTDFTDAALIRDYIRYIKDHFNVTEPPPSQADKLKIGIITRKGRRRILNEEELLTSVPDFEIELVEFSGKTFQEQVEMMQKYRVLAGINGAGLMNGLYLPKFAVLIQMVPYKAQLNFVEYGALMKARGPYMEWHNTHENLHSPRPEDRYNNHADTRIHVGEFRELIKKAVDLVTMTIQSDMHKNDEL